MKKIQTGETIYLKNIGDIRNLKINEYFFNFTRDISTPTYELVSLKYIFRAYECDDPYKEGTKELMKHHWLKYYKKSFLT